MNNSNLIFAAQIISLVFSPFYMPLLAFVALLLFSYMSMTPLAYKIYVLALVYIFTILIPRLLILLYRKLNGWERIHLSFRINRYVPYVLSILSYATLLYLFYNLHMPHFIVGIIAGALAIQIVCALTNNFIKVSTHAAAAGGVCGALVAFSVIFNFNPLVWLSLAILMCGVICSARLILRVHTLPEVGWGVLIGVLCGFFSIWII